MASKKKIGVFIAYMRKQRELSRDELGKRVSLGRIQIGNIETGKTPRVMDKYIAKLAKALAIPKNDLEAINPKRPTTKK